MIKKISQLLILQFLILLSCANKHVVNYEGEYSFGSGTKGGGLIVLNHINNDEYAYYMEFFRGEPSYNSGSLHGKMTVKDNKFSIIFEAEFMNSKDDNCHIEFKFNKDTLIVKQISDFCGFGYGVNASGKYHKTKDKSPNSIIDRQGDTLYFEQIDSWYIN